MALLRGIRTRGILDRDPLSDLWRNTLSQIPSVFGRLFYLAALRNSNSGRYEHHGLAMLYSEKEADRALRRSHLQTFSEWLCFNLEQQKSDLEMYLSDQAEPSAKIIETWRAIEPFRSLMPTTVSRSEAALYQSDFQLLLELMRNEFPGGVRDRSA